MTEMVEAMASEEGGPGGMSPKEGALVLSLQYMRMAMDGNRDGTDKVSTTDVLARFPL